MADLKQNANASVPPRVIGPGGPGGNRGNMHARIMREKPKNIKCGIYHLRRTWVVDI